MRTLNTKATAYKSALSQTRRAVQLRIAYCLRSLLALFRPGICKFNTVVLIYRKRHVRNESMIGTNRIRELDCFDMIFYGIIE